MNLQRPSQADLDRMNHAEKDVLIFQLFDLVSTVVQRLDELEGRVEKTGRNSSQPSSDGLRKGAAERHRHHPCAVQCPSSARAALSRGIDRAVVAGRAASPARRGQGGRRRRATARAHRIGAGTGGDVARP
jgi:hypothetical protein